MASRSTERAEESVERAEERLRQARARLRQARARDGAAERRKETHMKIVAGGMLAEQVGGVENIDWDGLRKYLARYRDAARRAYGQAGHASIEDAAEACSCFERRMREERAAERLADRAPAVLPSGQADDSEERSRDGRV